MGRPRYQITRADHFFAAQWIRHKFQEMLEDFPTGNPSTAHQAQQAFEGLPLSGPGALQAWADSWLDTASWTQLKNAIRAQRKREKDKFRDKPKSIVLSHQAWYILSELAKRDGVTMSQFLIDRHYPELLQMESPDGE